MTGTTNGTNVPYDLDRLARRISEEDYTQLGELFAREDKPPPQLNWDPVAEDVPDPRLAQLLEYWRSLRVGGQDIPSAGAIDPLDMKFALGYLLLSDVIENGDDFRYRVYGSLVARLCENDLTGRCPSEFGDARSTYIVATYKAAMIRREPLYMVFPAIVPIDVKVWRRLVLPLAGADGEIVRFLAAMIPESFAAPTANI